MSLKNKACIVGIGSTEFTRNSGRSALEMAVDAALAACEDAGLEPSKIDGIVKYGTAGGQILEHTSEADVARALDCPNLSYFAETPWGGGACCSLVMQAAMAVATGVANYVLVYRSLQPASGAQRYGRPVDIPLDSHWSYCMPFGLGSPTSWVAMLATRWMHETGCTPDDLCDVAMVCRENAFNNPRAIFYQRPLTREQYYKSPMLVYPFRRNDTCLENDGAVALIVTTPERARDLKQTPAFISGVGLGMAEDAFCMQAYYREKIGLPECYYAGRDAFKMAGLEPKDVDVVQFYDAFTPVVPIQLEQYGFVGPGEGAAFVRGGDRIRLTGELPINTAGGMLSEAYIHGVNMVAEAVRQVRGTSINQIPNVEVSMSTGGLGVPTSCVILTKG